ncbi:MAG: hypothetical protein QM747_10305 [Nocardioides sp.]
MSRARTLVLWVTAWCGVVAVVATLVWVVIGRAGAGLVPAASQGTDRGSLTASEHPEPTSGPSPGVRLTPRASASATTSDLPTASSSTPTSPATSTGSPSAHSSSTAPASGHPQRGSWNGGAGHVAAECRGSQITLVSAYPDAGWRYNIVDRGGDRVVVRFVRLGEDHGERVTGRCSSGVPRFSVTNDELGDD